MRDISDLSRMDEYRDLFQGVDAVVHLAHLRAASDSLHDRYLAERGDIDMAYIVYQLALDEGVKRVVVASSNHATDFYERPLRAGEMDTVYPEGSAQRPLADNYYGWAKEALRAPGVRVRLRGGGRPDRRRGPPGGPAAQAGGRPDPHLRPARPEHHQFRGLAQGRPADPAPRSRAVGQPEGSGAVVRQVRRGADIEDEYGIPFQVFYGVSANTRSAVEHRQRPPDHRLRARRTTPRWSTPTRSAR